MSEQDPAAAPAPAGETDERSTVPVRFEPRALRRAVVTVLVIVTLWQLGLWVFDSLRDFLFLLLLAWLVSIAMEPGVAWLANRGLRRGVATGIVGVVFGLLSVAFLALFGGLFFTQLAELVRTLPETVTTLISWVNSTFGLSLDEEQILDQLSISPTQLAEIAGNLAGGVFGVVGLVFGAVFDALTLTVFAFYLSADGPRLRRVLGSWLPRHSQQVFITLWDIMVIKTGGFVVSKVVLASLSAFFHCAMFAVLDVPYWLFMGIFAGVVSQFIPTIGTYIGIIVPATFAALVDPVDVIWIVVFATAYQQLENYVFTPRVSRVTMDVHPAVALGAVFAGVALFGPIGAIIGIPLAAAVIAVIEAYTQRHELVPELRARTKGEKPPRAGDRYGGDPLLVVPAGTPLTDAAVTAYESRPEHRPETDAD
jgi:predicted PurR-regulated permease PerM